MSKLPFVVEPSINKVEVGPDDCKVELTRRGKIDELEAAWLASETDRYQREIMPVEAVLSNVDFVRSTVLAYGKAISDDAREPGEDRLIIDYLDEGEKSLVAQYPEVFSNAIAYAQKISLFSFYAAAAVVARFRLGQSQISVWDMQGWVGDYGSAFVGALANFYRCERDGLPWSNESLAQPKAAGELAGTDVPVAAQGELL
jgi:hypothetical protein